MKIVFASYVYSPGFNDPCAWIKHINFYLGTLEALAKTDTVISIEQINYEGRLEKNGVLYHFMKLTKKERLFPGKLHRLIKSQNPDVVLIHGMQYPLQVIQLRLALGPKVIIMTQHHADRPFKGLKKQVAQLADRCTNAYLFSSKDIASEWITQGIIHKPSKVKEVMPVASVFSPINREAARSKTGVSGHPVFLWVGRLNDNKNPISAVKVFLRYLKLQPEARLYMIYQNDDLLPDINKVLSAEPHYKNNIVLVGKIPHHELLYWFNSADFIISNSYRESGGAAVSEALSCGCIPVITDIDSFRVITDNGKCGVLFEAGNEEAMFNALLQTRQMDIPAKRKHTLEYYSATLSFNAIANRFRDIATTLLSV
jgi:glycosyltransferase involved in cell wall biosynthesis